MGLNFNSIVPILIAALTLWLAGLTVVFFRLLSHYRKVAQKAKGGDITKALDNVLKAEKENNETLEKVKKELRLLDKNAANPLQKMGFVRFNPFNETGGDHSFSICILDRQDTGFVITGLHTRDKTRIYAKPIVNAKSKFELSKEEQKSLSQAIKNR